MIISLRPNSRASSDRAPGPRQIREIAITADKAAVMWASNELTLEPGNHAKTLLTAASAAKTATNRVNSPISSRTPASIPKHTIDTGNRPLDSCLSLKYVTPCVMRTAPMAARNSIRPAPGHPSGNVENIWSSDPSPVTEQSSDFAR